MVDRCDIPAIGAIAPFRASRMMPRYLNQILASSSYRRFLNPAPGPKLKDEGVDNVAGDDFCTLTVPSSPRGRRVVHPGGNIGR